MTKLEQELKKAIDRRAELGGELEAVQAELEIQRGRLADDVYNRANPKKTQDEIIRLNEQEQALKAAIQKADGLVTGLSADLEAAKKDRAIKEIQQLEKIGSDHVVAFFSALYQAEEAAEKARAVYKDMIEIQNRFQLGSDGLQLQRLITWVEYNRNERELFLNKFSKDRPDLAKAAQK